MTRDPSDGSVRDVDEKLASMSARSKLPSDDKPLMSSTTSGLPAASARDVDRHQRSREWLKEYREKRNAIGGVEKA